jgi:multidrug efflux system membrane fusion protein
MKNQFARINQRNFSAFLLLLGIMISAWFIFSKPTALPRGLEEAVYPVDVIFIEAENIRPEISVFGNVRAARTANINSMIAGKLVSVSSLFRDGSFVSAGSELALIDSVEYELSVKQRQAEVDRVKALISELSIDALWESKLMANIELQSKIAATDLRRLVDLEGKGLASKKNKDESELVFVKSESMKLQHSQSLERINSRIIQNEAKLRAAEASLAIAQRDLLNTRVIAPFDGYLTDIRAANGQRLSSGETIGRLLSATELEVVFDVPDDSFFGLSTELQDGGQRPAGLVFEGPLEVVWRLGSVAKVFKAKLARQGAEMAPELGGVKFYASLAEGAHLEGLRSGAFVEVKMKLQTYKEVFRLPSTAVTSDSRVYVIDNERLRAVDVVILRSMDDELLIRADLPSSGASVVSRVFPQIGEGLKVNPRASD